MLAVAWCLSDANGKNADNFLHFDINYSRKKKDSKYIPHVKQEVGTKPCRRDSNNFKMVKGWELRNPRETS